METFRILCEILEILCLAHVCFTKTDELYFEEFCGNKSKPDEFPGNGKASAKVLAMNSVEKGYEAGLNCSVTLTTEPGYEMLITFSSVNLRNSSLDVLTISYDKDHQFASLSGQQVCSNENCVGLKFESGNGNPNITLNFISANITVSKNYTGFIAICTSFNYVDSKSGSCHGVNRFLCANKHCISNLLVCDGHNNCGDLSDEVPCAVSVKDTIWGVFVIAIGVFSMIIFVPLFCFLAVYGTHSVVKSVTLPNHATPLYSTINDGERTGLLTSSEAFNECWHGSSNEKPTSHSYGTACDSDSGPSTNSIKEKQ